jgi:hypothetical protein
MIDRKPFENGSNPSREREEAVLRGVSGWLEPSEPGLRVGTAYRRRSGAGIWEMSMQTRGAPDLTRGRSLGSTCP